ncbi:MAG: hypothetical protein M1480_03195 [Bacteroidetes bacterium]|nr:hypothetical protein [Bacteroidota bacterium]
MARIKGSILGTLRGTVGNFTSRIVKGENLVCKLPASFTPPNNSAAIIRRQSFAMASKLTRTIYRIPMLKTLWENLTPAGVNTYNFIFRTNYRQLLNGNLTDLNTITPLFGFPITASSINPGADSFQVEIAAVFTASDFNTSVEVNAKLVMVIHMSKPVDSQGEDFFLQGVGFNTVPFKTDSPLAFSASLQGEDQLRYSKYSEHKVFLALVTLDSNNEPVKFSATIASNQ